MSRCFHRTVTVMISWIWALERLEKQGLPGVVIIWTWNLVVTLPHRRRSRWDLQNSFTDVSAANFMEWMKAVLLSWCSRPLSTQPLQRGIKRFSVLHPLLNTVQSSFFNVWCLIDPCEVCLSHHTLWYGKSNCFLTALSFTELSVVSVTTGPLCHI